MNYLLSSLKMNCNDLGFCISAFLSVNILIKTRFTIRSLYKNGTDYQGQKTTRYGKTFNASIPDNEYQMKSCIMVEISQSTTSEPLLWKMQPTEISI